MGSKLVKNDTAAFTCVRMIPGKDGIFNRHVVYLDSISDNVETSVLATLLKRLYYDFESDYAVIDSTGNGIGVYDSLASLSEDYERGVEYEAWTSINDEELKKRFINNDGKPVLYTVKGNAKFNNDIAVLLRSAIKNGKIKFPMNDIQRREEYVVDQKSDFLKKSPEEQNKLLAVYQRTSALISELVTLEYVLADGGNVKIKEVGSATKDRYSSLAYVNYWAEQIEREAQKEVESDLDDFFFINNWK